MMKTKRADRNLRFETLQLHVGQEQRRLPIRFLNLEWR